MQVEGVFSVSTVEEALDNLASCGERWAQIALHNMGEARTISIEPN